MCGKVEREWVSVGGEILCFDCAIERGLNLPQLGTTNETLQDRERELLRLKRAQYASDDDPLVNFKQIGQLIGLEPHQVAMVLLMKHIQAIAKAVMSDGWRGVWTWRDTMTQEEGLKQRIADARNYLLLLAECLDEEAEKGDDRV